MTDEDALEDAKSRFTQAEMDIQRVRRQIALRDCRLRVGDRVNVEDNGQRYEGVVDRIDAAAHPSELFGPKPGVPSGWAANGYRIRKGDGARSKWTFGFTSFTAMVKGGVWIVKERSLEAALGLPKQPRSYDDGG